MSEMKNNNKIITRFAPSPTGFMHVGGVRTALFSWLFAKKNKGIFILRIEDTDKKREVEGSIEHIIKSLKWLGLNWDEGPDIGGPNGPYIQSQRLETYKKYAQELYEKGLAYADPYTEEELETFRKKSDEDKKAFLYRDHRPENPPKWDGTKPLRLKIIDIKRYVWNDLVRGELSAGPEALDDFILMKSDGYPTYNFAHIIDDLYMGVTHIFRADEFISSTPKFLALYEALGITRPEFATLPPIMGPDGKKKLGKRDGAKDILDYKSEGYLPEAVINFLAFIGWNPGDEREIMSIKEIIEAFDINKIQSAGGKFNEEKLLWFNKEYIKKLPKEKIVEEIKKRFPENCQDEKIIEKISDTITERINVFSDIDKMVLDGDIQYFFEEPKLSKEMIIWKKGGTLEQAKENLSLVTDILNKISDKDFTLEIIKENLMKFAEEKGKGNVLWPLRVALSGKEKSPDPFTLLFLLGKDESIKRIKNAIDFI
jgi:glutamyl-tRNA synthetase